MVFFERNGDGLVLKFFHRYDGLGNAVLKIGILRQSVTSRQTSLHLHEGFVR